MKGNMKSLTSTLFVGLLLATACAAQTPTILTNNEAPRPSINSVTNAGTGGSTTYYYWVVAIYAGGNSAPAGPLVTSSSNATLSTTNYNSIAFTAPTSPLSAVTGYDLLRTTTPSVPTGACACAVLANQAATPIIDVSNTLSAYTVSTLANVVAAIVGDPVSVASLPLVKVKNGTSVITLPSGAARDVPMALFCGATSGTTTCANATGAGTSRVFGGIATLASNSAVISGISPAFTSTSTFTCVANDLTTRANPVQVANTSSSSITITNTTGASDVINYICIGY